MTKIVIIADTHIGGRGGASFLLEAQRKFFREVFFPFFGTENIDAVIHLGDLVDRRKGIDFKVSTFLRHEFLIPLQRLGIPVHMIVGNHDCPTKNSLRGNSLQELVEGRYDFHCYSEPSRRVIGNKSYLFLPWICQENEENSLRSIGGGADYVFGHLELTGFKMYKNTPLSTHGMSSDIFSRCGNVFTGHYHEKSSGNRVHYLGAPYEMTWGDYGCERGFHVLDTKTDELDFYANPFTIFDEIRYDGNMGTDYKTKVDGKIIRLVVQERGKASDFDAFVKRLEDSGAEEVIVVDQPKVAEKPVVAPTAGTGDDMLDLLKNSTIDLKNRFDKETLDVFLEGVYREAIGGI